MEFHTIDLVFGKIQNMVPTTQRRQESLQGWPGWSLEQDCIVGQPFTLICGYPHVEHYNNNTGYISTRYPPTKKRSCKFNTFCSKVLL